VALEALEMFVLPEVIRNLSPKKLEGIEKAMGEFVRAASVPQYRRLLLIKDTNFHLKIVESAGNEVIYNLCKRVLEQIYLKYRPEYMREERIKEAEEEHRMLLNAMRDRDLKRAARLLKQHIHKGRDHIVGSLTQDKRLEI
jgi:DNA-binding GntR family transcriptional regulator